MTIRGLQRLLAILGCRVEAKFRALVGGVFTRVLNGDQSLIEVINATEEPVIDSLKNQRRMDELDIEILEAELEAKKLANAVLARNTAREHLTKITQQYRELCQDSVMDERTRSILKDGFLQMAKL